jgi:hypothetical protein
VCLDEVAPEATFGRGFVIYVKRVSVVGPDVHPCVWVRRGRRDSHHKPFRELPLYRARHISEHRTGVPPVTVTVTGRFGLTYSGSPTKMIPMPEAQEMPPELGWMQNLAPIQPVWTNFAIDGKPLFEACREHLQSTQALIERARELAESVHGSSKLTSPPVEM